MQKEAEKLEIVILKMQKVSDKLAAMPVSHGLKTKHKQFWEEYFVQLQEAAINMIAAVEVHSGKEFKMPFSSDEFKKAWQDWQFYNYHEAGKFLSEIRSEKQLESLAHFCEDDKEAIKTLNYLINRGYSYIFKVNFETEKTKTNNSQIPDGEF